MQIRKKNTITTCFALKKIIMFFSLAILVATNFHAASVHITVLDKELGLPLEGVKISTSQNGEIQAETDYEGKADFELADSTSKNLFLSIPGYKTERITLKKNYATNEVFDFQIEMSISDVIEGKELIVQRSAPGQTDEKSGVSIVMEKEQFESTARVGLVEDIMSSVETLPGVTETGVQPSIRGGYPADTVSVMDGVYMINPWQFSPLGTTASIFDPGMVDSFKMSNGVFSARYGRTLAGLLEINTVNPKSEKAKFDVSVSTLMTSAYMEIPFTNKMGLFVTGKISYFDQLLKLFNIDEIPTPPFVRNAYAKFYYNPSEKLNFTLSGFIGDNGTKIESENEKDGHTNKINIDYNSLQGFGALNAKWLPTEKLQFNSIISYSFLTNKTDYFSSETGDYTFKENGQSTNYQIDNLVHNDYNAKTTNQYIETKVEADYELTKNLILTGGVDELYSLTKLNIDFKGNQESKETDGSYTYKYYDASIDIEGNHNLNSSAYALFTYGSESTFFLGEAGVRIDHFFSRNKKDDITISSDPSISPRLYGQITPLRNKGIVNKLSFSTGTGLFSAMPADFETAEKSRNLDSAEWNRAIFTVLGTEIQFENNWTFKLEGFYRYTYSRLYRLQEEKFAMPICKTDGKGQSFGFDLMLTKKLGEHFNGYLSYSFVNARYLNPTKPTLNMETTANGDPLDEWYYPNFHRFHNLNMVLNFKPNEKWNFMVKAAFITGTPSPEYEEIKPYTTNYNGTEIKKYRHESHYSDSLREKISFPVDLRVSYTKPFKNGNGKWEVYGGVENILGGLFKQKGEKKFDEYTGEELEDSSSGVTNIPIPSVGFKISF